MGRLVIYTIDSIEQNDCGKHLAKCISPKGRVRYFTLETCESKHVFSTGDKVKFSKQKIDFLEKETEEARKESAALQAKLFSRKK